MSTVPDTSTFSLQDVVDVVGGTSLVAAFSNSVDSYFDPAYKGSKDALYCFRNYDTSVSIDVSDYGMIVGYKNRIYSDYNTITPKPLVLSVYITELNSGDGIFASASPDNSTGVWEFRVRTTSQNTTGSSRSMLLLVESSTAGIPDVSTQITVIQQANPI